MFKIQPGIQGCFFPSLLFNYHGEVGVLAVYQDFMQITEFVKNSILQKNPTEEFEHLFMPLSSMYVHSSPSTIALRPRHTTDLDMRYQLSKSPKQIHDRLPFLRFCRTKSLHQSFPRENSQMKETLHIRTDIVQSLCNRLYLADQCFRESNQ